MNAGDIRRSRVLVWVLAATMLTAVPLSSASAQMGVRGGLSLSDLVGADVTRSDSRAGFTGGFAVTLLSMGPLSLAPEVHYVAKGAGAATFAGDEHPTFEDFALDYVEVPVVLRLGFPLPVGGGALRGYGEGGPALAWRLNCSIVPTGGEGPGLSDDCAIGGFEGAESVVNAADQGAVFGLGLVWELPVVGGALILDGRLTRGLSRLEGSGGTLDARNRSFAFSLGYDVGF